MGDLLNDGKPAWATVEAFVLACQQHATSQRLATPEGSFDPAGWRRKYKHAHGPTSALADASLHATGATAPPVSRRPAGAGIHSTVAGSVEPVISAGHIEIIGFGDTIRISQTAAGAHVPTQPLTGLVELPLDDGDLPAMRDLDPYQLGASPTEFGDRDTYRQQDQYVPRTRNNVDDVLRDKLVPGRLVVVVGPSKTGKTRTAFEAVQERWPDARVLAPVPALGQLARHPRIEGSTDLLVVWLDDLQRFLTTTDALTPAVLVQLTARPGPTLLIATLRREERDRLTADTGELTRDTRQLLNDATVIELGPTSDDDKEQAAARAAYPSADLSIVGLGERLAGAPQLLRQYRDAQPILLSIVQTAIDWARVGMQRPIPADDLTTLALDRLFHDHPELDPSDADIAAALHTARMPPRGAGRVAALRTVPLADGTRGYRVFDYLIAQDDNQTDAPRPIPTTFWDQALQRANPEDAFTIGITAYERSNLQITRSAWEISATAGNTAAMVNLGVLLSDYLQPPDLDRACVWYERAATAGHTDGMVGLGNLLSDSVRPPDLEGARTWYERAATAGNTDAMNNLGNLLCHSVRPPDLVGARTWYERAATAGNILAMNALGLLLAYELQPPDLKGGRNWLERGATAGDTDAMNNLGVLLAYELQPPDLEGARAWLERAATAGNADAMFSLGVLLAGKVRPPDLEGARSWYEAAATAGNTSALNNLGILLASQMQPPDLEGARVWYERAATAGDTIAMANLGGLLAGQVQPPDLEGAYVWYERAATAGNIGAMNSLGILLSSKMQPPDLEGARGWYEAAAAAGNTNAMNNIGAMLAYQVQPRDLEAARTWYERAAEAGHTLAMNSLGVLLCLEVQGPDLDGARTWYERAADAGNTDAMVNLGNLLSDQLQPPDLDGARAWYERAANSGNTNAMVCLGILLSDQLQPPDLGGARAWRERAATADTDGRHPEGSRVPITPNTAPPST
ncbi:tetratricopeptide repeat protein [Fodinicola feengrottensis]|uniref:tetratricopeptide repeat protein n=1 Tax=Fodinicola feengrottensis TaxID=435914 RepID=UPI0031CEEDB6